MVSVEDALRSGGRSDHIVQEQNLSVSATGNGLSTSPSYPSIAVVAGDLVTSQGLAHAIDPVTERAGAMTVAQAVAAVSSGAVRVLVLCPRGVDAAPLIAALRRQRVCFIVAMNGLTEPPASVSEVRPIIVTSLDELIATINRVVSLSTGLALTNRHVEILQRIAMGDTPNEAAVALGITVKTLNNHLGVVYRRLGARNVTQAVLAAVRAGMVRL
jgi:DNA-binding CsgD family transcriptional regulator